MVNKTVHETNVVLVFSLSVFIYTIDSVDLFCAEVYNVSPGSEVEESSDKGRNEFLDSATSVSSYNIGVQFSKWIHYI